MSTLRDLITLISGLSKKEKADFEQYASRQGGSKLYMRVYHVVERLISGVKPGGELPSEEVFATRIRLEVKGGSGNLTAHCNYLFGCILRSLRNVQNLIRKEEEIFQDINNAKILARRGLFEAAISSLENAYSTSILYEYQAMAIQALRALVYMEGQRDSKSYAAKIRARLINISELAELQTLESYYYRLHYRGFLLTRSRLPLHHDEVKSELAEIMGDPLLDDFTKANTFFSKVYFWQAKATLANMLGPMDEAMAASMNIIELWQHEDYKHFQEEHPRLYIIHLHNLVLYAINLGKFDTCEKYLDIMADVTCNNFDDEAEQFQNVLFSRQLLLLNTNRPLEAVKLVSGKLKDIEGRYDAKINTARLISLYYNTLVACFSLKDYAAAQEWSEKIYQIGKTEQRRDIQFINKVFQIIIRFELNELHYLDTEIKNTNQNLRDHGQMDALNGIFLLWLAKLVRNKQDEAQGSNEQVTNEKALFLEFKNALEGQKNSAENQQIMGLDEVLLWVTGRLKQLY